MTRPLIGITSDNKENRIESGHYESAVAYSRAITLAGGLPLILPQEVTLIGDYLRLCAGFLLTGGADARMERFGQSMHPKAKPVPSQRQLFELALLDELAKNRRIPALGICLGMQFMSLHAGGRLNQQLADTLGEQALAHQQNNRHPVKVEEADCVLAAVAQEAGDPTVVSWHRQAIEESGSLRIIARAPDGVIEAVDDPARPFYVGVQWHPERGGDGPFNGSLLARFVNACRKTQ